MSLLDFFNEKIDHAVKSYRLIVTYELQLSEKNHICFTMSFLNLPLNDKYDSIIA